jgi:hypothetical protein
MSTPRFDGKTGRPLVPLTPEERREQILHTIESIKQWDRDHVWWRRAGRAAVGHLRVWLHWGT